MRYLAEIQFRDLIIKIHSLTGFCVNIRSNNYILSWVELTGYRFMAGYGITLVLDYD